MNLLMIIVVVVVVLVIVMVVGDGVGVGDVGGTRRLNVGGWRAVMKDAA